MRWRDQKRLDQLGLIGQLQLGKEDMHTCHCHGRQSETITRPLSPPRCLFHRRKLKDEITLLWLGKLPRVLVQIGYERYVHFVDYRRTVLNPMPRTAGLHRCARGSREMLDAGRLTTRGRSVIY